VRRVASGVTLLANLVPTLLGISIGGLIALIVVGAMSNRRRDPDSETVRPKRRGLRWIGVLSLIALVAPIVVLVKLDRGAPLHNHANEPRLEDWQMISLGGREGGGVICDRKQPCHASALTPRQKDGVSCVWVAHLLLNALSEPFVMRDVHLSAYVSVQYPLATYVTTGVTGFEIPWDRGWWWRAEPQRVTLSVPMPCGGFPISLVLQIRGKDLFGRSREDEQGLSLSNTGTLP